MHAVLCFCFLELGIRPSVFTKFKLNQVNLWVAGGGYVRGAHSAR